MNQKPNATKYILSLLLTAFSFFAYPQTIPPEQAKDSINKKVTVFGVVTGKVKDHKGKPEIVVDDANQLEKM